MKLKNQNSSQRIFPFLFVVILTILATQFKAQSDSLQLTGNDVSSAGTDSVSLRRDSVKYTVNGIVISTGKNFYRSIYVGVKDASSVFGDSKILQSELAKIDPSVFEADSKGNSNGGLAYSPDNVSNTVNFGVIIGKKEDNFKGPWFTASLSYFSKSKLFEGGVYKNTHVRQDTFYTNFGSPVSRDSLISRNLYYNYSYESINTEFAATYKLKPDGVFSASGGLGCLLGLSFNSQMNISYRQTAKILDTIRVNSFEKALYNSSEKIITEEEQKYFAPPVLNCGLFITLAVNIKLGTSYELFRRTHIFGEIKPLLRTALTGTSFKSTITYVGNIGIAYDFR